MKTKSLLTFGVLAVLAYAGYKYYTKSKGTGYANASGFSKASPIRCTRCRTMDGGTYVPARDSYPQCDFKAGERCLTNAV